MDEKDKHIRSYTTSDIRRYLDGELSPSEMHALERAAMDDPFLADAINGMEWNDGQGDVPFETATAELSRRLLERTDEAAKKSRLLPFFRWDVAAMLLLLLGAGYTGYWLLVKDKEPRSTISTITPKPALSDTIAQPSIPAAVEEQKQLAPAAKQQKETAGKTTRREAKPDQTGEEDKKEDAEINPKPAAAPVVSETVKTKPDAGVRSIDAGAPPVDKDRKTDTVIGSLQGSVAGVEISRGRKKNQPDQTARYLRGFAIDSGGRPISKATVTLKNSDRAATTTDENGYFKLKSFSQDSSQDVVVSSPGYAPSSHNLSLSGAGNDTIQLEPANKALDEVVVTALGMKRKKDLRPTNEAQPKGGWDTFYAYVNKNKRTALIDSSLHGIESISFFVHKNGKLFDFKVEQSVSTRHDAELIRLIKAGPAWITTGNKKQQVRITVSF